MKYTALQNLFWNTQLTSMIVSYNVLTAESDSEIDFSPIRLDFAAHKITIFEKQ